MTSRRIRPLRAALASVLTLLAAIVLVPAPAAHAADDSGLSVTITGLTPSTLPDDPEGSVRLTGAITNDSDEPWTAVQAYLLIRPTPLATRSDLRSAAEIDRGFTGTRITQTGLFDELGTLQPGQATTFDLSVPFDDLPISGAEGVYPIGVQVLATDSQGERSNNAVARATTLLPHVSEDREPADSTVVWSFLMPQGRTADGDIVDADSLIQQMSTGGSLRNLLDLAASSNITGRGFIIDPALISAADDLADGRSAGRDVSEQEQQAIGAFRDQLVDLARDSSSWIMYYDRPDLLALVADKNQRDRLIGVVERATDSVIREHNLSRSRVVWPSLRGVSQPFLTALKGYSDAPVITSTQTLDNWSTEDGVLVGHTTSGGGLVDLLINDDITDQIPGETTVATLRQRMLSSSALAALEGGRAESLVIVDPSFDPGVVTGSPLNATPSFVQPTRLSEIRRGSLLDDDVPRTAEDRPISKAQIAAAAGAARISQAISVAAVDSIELEDRQARLAASTIATRWRRDRAAGTEAATAIQERMQRMLDSITVQGPETVTLSSEAGVFPITVSNGTDATIRVGVRLDSSNPSLVLPDQEPVEIAAGERRTISVDVDLADQNATTVTAHLTAPDGSLFGSSEEFIVRSSRVGMTLWVLMGAAGLLVVFALGRRFIGRRRSSKPVEVADE